MPICSGYYLSSMLKNLLLLPFLALFAGSVSAMPLPTEDPASVAAQSELKVLTYNIKMLPRVLTFIKHHPVVRARIIPRIVAPDSAQVIVFQEAFDHKAIRILKRELKPYYPFWAGPANSTPSLKASSGVMVFSKVPLKELGEVHFTDCDREDCLARKGAILVQLQWKGNTVQVMGTHMEAGGAFEMKQNQYEQIEGLMKRFRKDSIPQLYCGDFNTHKGSALYDTMLHTFTAEDGPITGDLQYTSDHLLNDMDSYDPNRRGVIDFVLYKGNGLQPKTLSREVKRYQFPWDKKHKDLSDHFAVMMKLRL